jgi:hypothetical protein
MYIGYGVVWRRYCPGMIPCRNGCDAPLEILAISQLRQLCPNQFLHILKDWVFKRYGHAPQMLWKNETVRVLRKWLAGLGTDRQKGAAHLPELVWMGR